MSPEDKIIVFLEVANVLNTKLKCVPVLYGSLGLWRVANHKFYIDDVDILVPDEFLLDKWHNLKLTIERLGFNLIDLHEREFERNGQKVAFGKISILARDLGITKQDLKLAEIHSVNFLELNLKQYLFAYKYVLLDSYRQNIKHKRDLEKITFIEEILNQ